MSHNWIGRATDRDLTSLQWPQISPKLTLLDFLYIVYVPPLPRDAEHLKWCISITTEVAQIDRQILKKVRVGMGYWVGICGVTH